MRGTHPTLLQPTTHTHMMLACIRYTRNKRVGIATHLLGRQRKRDSHMHDAIKQTHM